MRASLLAAILALMIPAAALAQTAPGHYSYIQLRHDGFQEKSPPSLRIGLADKLPPLPVFSDFRDAPPQPFNLLFLTNNPVDQTQFGTIRDLTHGLNCRDTVDADGTELTVTEVVDDHITFICFLRDTAAKAYAAKLDELMPASGTGAYTPVGALSDFINGSHALPLRPDGESWIEMQHRGNWDDPYPTVIMGAEPSLPPVSATSGIVRIVLSPRQYQLARIERQGLMCAKDQPGVFFDDDIDVRSLSSDKRTAADCKLFGGGACYYLHTLYAMSYPEHEIDGIEAVRRLSGRLGCDGKAVAAR